MTVNEIYVFLSGIEFHDVFFRYDFSVVENSVCQYRHMVHDWRCGFDDFLVKSFNVDISVSGGNTLIIDLDEVDYRRRLEIA